MMPCSVVVRYQDPRCLQLKREVLTVEAAGISETSVLYHGTAWRYKPENFGLEISFCYVQSQRSVSHFFWSMRIYIRKIFTVK